MTKKFQGVCDVTNDVVRERLLLFNPTIISLNEESYSIFIIIFHL